MKDLLVTSRLFSALPGITHGVTTRMFGDVRTSDAILYTGVKQVHGSAITVVRQTSSELHPDADGIVTKMGNLTIGVRTADCVPILMADVQNRVVAAVHAGWKGIVQHVVERGILAMRHAGAHMETTIVYIGPHIGACCYTVPKSRADQFNNRFEHAGQWHIDIGAEVRDVLIASGIAPGNIDAPIMCTSCQHDTFFSYRRDSKATFGEMLSYISLS